jgi:transposase-like protein
MASEPKTLQEAIVYFSDPANCREYMVPRRWPNGVTCPACGTDKVTFQPKHNRWQCSVHHSCRQFTLKTGTVMEESPIGLEKWLPVIWMVANMKNGVSSWEIHRHIGVTQKTAWFMLQRARLAMQSDEGGKLDGEIEVDETFIGGKARNMHEWKRREKFGKDRIPGGPTAGDKAIVHGILKRGTEVRVAVVAEQ